MKQWEAKLTFYPYLEYSNQIKDITKYDVKSIVDRFNLIADSKYFKSNKSTPVV